MIQYAWPPQSARCRDCHMALSILMLNKGSAGICRDPMPMHDCSSHCRHSLLPQSSVSNTSNIRTPTRCSFTYFNKAHFPDNSLDTHCYKAFPLIPFTSTIPPSDSSHSLLSLKYGGSLSLSFFFFLSFSSSSFYCHPCFTALDKKTTIPSFFPFLNFLPTFRSLIAVFPYLAE